MFVLAHISDFQIDDTKVSVERAERVVDYLGGLPGPVDALAVTGDLADNGSPEEYAHVRRILSRQPYPTVTCPGNHDDRANYRAGLGLDGDGPVNQVLRLDGATIALCDSTIPGSPDGRLDDETLEWLDTTLASEPDIPAFVGMHHHPCLVGIPFVDRIRLRSPERLEALLGRHDNVVGVLTGHAHAGASTTFAGLPLIVAPGVASTCLPIWESGELRPLDFGLPPGISFHVVHEGRLTSYFRSVPVEPAAV